jgi:tetratricopeptide (TPR) repeat protein
MAAKEVTTATQAVVVTGKIIVMDDTRTVIDDTIALTKASNSSTEDKAAVHAAELPRANESSPEVPTDKVSTFIGKHHPSTPAFDISQSPDTVAPEDRPLTLMEMDAPPISLETKGSDSTPDRHYTQHNYDQTLINIDHDRPSQLLTEIKSESEVPMPPDCPKKGPFRHPSVRRHNHYKSYSSVAAAILLIILMFGWFEYKAELITIDKSLSALKLVLMTNRTKRPVLKVPSLRLTQSPNLGVGTKTVQLVGYINHSTELEQPITDLTVDESEVSETFKSGDAPIDEKKTDPAELQNKSRLSKANGISEEKPKVKMVNKAVLARSQPLRISSKNSSSEKVKWLKDAYTAYQSGDNNTALEKYNQVLADDPQNRNALLARAAINIHSGNNRDAVEDYQTLLIANPKDALAIASLISVVSIALPKLESQFKMMLRDEPSSPYLNFALANVYSAQDRWPEAQKHYFKALETNPNDPNYAYNLAVSLEHILKPKVAITYYLRALGNFNSGLATFDKTVVDQRVEILKQL